MIINTNVSSITAQEAATNTGKSISSSLEKLSTGLKINKASDDASGLAIADKLRTQATSIDQGVANGNSAVTLLQIADKSMSEQSNILDTIKAKLIQANTDTTSADGRESIRKDISKLLEQLDNIAEQTNYNGNLLLQKSATNTALSDALSFQIGETNRDTITNDAIRSNTAGLGSSITFSADKQNNTLISGSTTTLASEGVIKLTSTSVSGANTSETVALSGDIDSLELAIGTVISGLDSGSEAAFLAQAGTLGTDYTKSGTSYTMLTAKNLDLSAVTGTKTATITTNTEVASSYVAEIGDKITASTVKEGSALANALKDPAKFTDNLDGTYTSKVAETFTLDATETLDYSRATTEQSFVTGQTVTLTADVVAGSELANALADTTKFTLTSAAGTAGTSGATYTVAASIANVGIDDAEALTVTTPGTTAAAVNLGVAVGDMITLASNVVANSDLATALADTTKFELVSGTAGQTSAVYKALTAETIALESSESVSKSTATTVAIGSGSTFGAGSTLTLTNAAVAGSDLSNQLQVASGKFTLTGGTLGAAGSTYTVNANFTSDNIKLVAGEKISLTAVQPIPAPTGTSTLTALGFTPTGGGSTTALTVSGTNLQNGGADYQISQRGNLAFTATAGAANQNFNILAGDTVRITTDLATNGLGTSNQIKEHANWIDNGDGSYTAIANQTITFDDATDALSVTRVVGKNLTSTDYDSTTATSISRIDSADATTTVTGAANTSGSLSATAAVSINFTTNTSVDAKNNGLAANSLKVTGDGTNDVTNNGKQLSALSELGTGEFTQQIADTFQAVVDDAITGLNQYRGDIGSTQNQVESAVRNLMTQSTNVKAAESIIRDVDYAQESANFNKQNIISQAGSYAISQANSVQQNVLRLLQ